MSTSDVENYKQIKTDLDELRLLVEKSELWVFKSKLEEVSKKKKSNDDDADGDSERKKGSKSKKKSNMVITCSLNLHIKHFFKSLVNYLIR